jgi:hypothetical protein
MLPLLLLFLLLLLLPLLLLLLLLLLLQDTPDGPWSLKDKAGFIQTPQDFWNVDAAHPLVHSARFFYASGWHLQFAVLNLYSSDAAWLAQIVDVVCLLVYASC